MLVWYRLKWHKTAYEIFDDANLEDADSCFAYGACCDNSMLRNV